MKVSPHLFYYITAIGIMMVLKIGYTFSDTTDLLFLLTPTNAGVALFTNSEFHFSSENGYFHPALNILIDKSCAGFNFLVLCFTMVYVQTVGYLKGNFRKILALPIVLFGACLLTILVNISRILFSYFLSKISLNLLTFNPSWLHQAEGVFIYLSFLILIYLGVEFILNKTNNHHAELA